MPLDDREQVRARAAAMSGIDAHEDLIILARAFFNDEDLRDPRALDLQTTLVCRGATATEARRVADRLRALLR